MKNNNIRIVFEEFCNIIEDRVSASGLFNTDNLKMNIVKLVRVQPEVNPLTSLCHILITTLSLFKQT